MSLSLNRLVFDPADATQGSSVGAYLLAGDGSSIAKKVIAASNWLQTASALFASDGSSITQSGGALDINFMSQDADLDVNITNASLAVTIAAPLVIDDSTPVDINVTNASLAVTMASSAAVKSTAETVGTSEVSLAATPLASRKFMIVQNKGSKAIYVGATGVTTSTGTEIPAGGSLEVNVGAACALFAISSAAGQNVRVFEAA